MSAATFTWFDAMTMRVAALPKDSIRSNDWEQALQTVHLRIVCFAYHRDEYSRFQAAGLSSRSPGEGETAFIVAPIGQPAGAKLSINAALAVAQVIAAAQSLHATCNCLFRIADCALSSNGAIQQAAAGGPTLGKNSLSLAGRSKIELERLQNSPQFRFLDQFVQVATHQNLICARSRRIGQPNRKRVELLIRSFRAGKSWDGAESEAKWANDFLFTDCEVIIEQCNAFGKAIASEML